MDSGDFDFSWSIYDCRVFFPCMRTWFSYISCPTDDDSLLKVANLCIFNFIRYRTRRAAIDGIAATGIAAIGLFVWHRRALSRYLSQRFNSRLTFKTAGGLEVSIYKQDILTQNVDAVVCATTGDLDHRFGLAKLIADQAGSSIVQDCRSFMRQRRGRRLNVAEPMHTTSGGLGPNIIYVVHVVGPVAQQSTGFDQLRLDLIDTFYNCLTYANDVLKVKSVAIPALCSGYNGASRQTVAEAAYEALVKFDKNVAQNNSYLRDIRFVNLDDATNKTFVATFQTTLQQETPQVIDVVPRVPLTRKNRLKTPSDRIGMKPTPSTVNPDVNAVWPHGSKLSIGPPSTNMNGDISPDDVSGEDCVICMCPMSSPRRLHCGHSFCGDCIQQSFDKCGAKCPSCGRLYGVQRGNQPPGGTMTVFVDSSMQLAGYHGYGTIVVTYNIPDGIQSDDHPNPGQPYSGTRRTAYLPNNTEGQEVLGLLKQAFDAGLLFTVGRSVTTGAENVVVWNDVHHKTNSKGPYGYPDATYLTRVKAELAGKGISTS